VEKYGLAALLHADFSTRLRLARNDVAECFLQSIINHQSSIINNQFSAHLSSLEQGNSQRNYPRRITQGISSTYQDVFEGDRAAFINGIANPEDL
jgi:hypothetical protein